MYRQSSTIFALSSGQLPSGVAVMRLSGAATRFALETICGTLPEPRRATLAKMRFADGSILDRGLVLFFPGPNSFTGEDAGELHLHGGRAVVAAMLERLGGLPGLLPAEPGEFARRAFLNGKLDLTAAEGLADLIDADTEFQRRLALENADGAQARLYEGWRRRILHARAMIEAELDFADEGDVPGSVAEEVWSDIRDLRADVQRHRHAMRDGEIVRGGFKVALVGAPNAGKSSLLNRLAGRDAAIVTAEAGTTRDVIEVALDLGGVKVRLFDTAGLREGGGTVESIGMERARRVAGTADLVLALDDATTSERIALDPGWNSMRVISKVDLRKSGQTDVSAVSSVTGEGIDELISTIAAMARRRAAAALSEVVPTRLRHAGMLDEMLRGLGESLSQDAVLELRAEGLRLAGDSVGRLTGAINTEELLGSIFSRFCIGK